MRVLGAASGTRFTIINRNGHVLADSVHDPSTMQNHSDRPEVKAALAGHVGMATRISPTLGVPETYVAIPFPQAGRPVGRGACGRPAHQRQRCASLAVLAHRHQRRDHRRRECRARLRGVATHQPEDARDQAGRRAVRFRRLRLQARRFAHGGVRRGGREPQPDGAQLDGADPHGHRPEQRTRGHPLEHGRGSAGRGHRRACHHREPGGRGHAGRRRGSSARPQHPGGGAQHRAAES